MIDILDVFYSIIKQFDKCIADSKHWLGALPEKIERPSFLYTLVFTKDTQSSYFTKDTTLDLQIIYFGQLNEFGIEIYDDRLQTMGNLKEFLSQFNMKVKDRNLKFDYSFNEADGQLAIDIHFKFKDGLVNLKYDEEQAREMIENINFNKELI